MQNFASDRVNRGTTDLYNKSPLILQPGPAALTDGLDAIVKALWPEQ